MSIAKRRAFLRETKVQESKEFSKEQMYFLVEKSELTRHGWSATSKLSGLDF